METRLIIAYLLIAMLVVIAIYGGVALAKRRALARRKHSRKMLF